MMPDSSPLCTDLRRVSSGAPQQYESALTRSLRSSLDQESPWLTAAQQLTAFPTKRCVQMRPADWQELSGVFATIARQSAAVRAASSSKHATTSSAIEQGSSNPGFVAILELLLQLGRVTSCLLCVNGDDRSFSIARVAQAIRTTTSVVEAALAQAIPAGLSAEVADRLARQRCEQTPLLSAVTWALRQEARALFFNPRPTALSLATALLDLFRVVEHLWPRGIFVPQQHEVSLDATAARMADPAAQLALAMLRCAGRAMADVGPGACRESLLCGLHVGYDMVGQISTLLDAGLLSSHESLVKQLQHSPSLPQLMLALLAVETHRLNQQLGISETDSCIKLEQKQQQRSVQDGLTQQRSKRQSSCAGPPSIDPDAQQQVVAQVEQQALKQQRLSGTDSARLSRRCSSAVDSPGAVLDLQQQDSSAQPDSPPLASLRRTLSQQCLLQQQQLQQQRQEEEEHEEIEGAGELHQVWHQVLGMARKNLARDGQAEEQEEAAPRSPLMQLWVSLGLPEALLQLAADAGVSPAAPAQQYVAVCRVGKFLLQGSALLQPQHEHTPHEQRPPSPAAAAAAAGPLVPLQPTSSAAVAVSPWQQSPFAGLSARPPSRTQSASHRAAPGGVLPPAWQSSSPAGGSAAGTALATAYSMGDPLAGPMASVGSLSPRELLQPGGALSVSAETAEQLMEACRDTGLKGQEQLELLRLQRVVPVVLLNTAASLLQRRAATSATAAAAAAAAAGGGGDAAGSERTATTDSSSRTSSDGRAGPELQVVHAACTAAACVSRCWPVLQKVAEQQEELVELLSECHPPAGVYAGLTTVCWRPYTLPNEVRLPVLQLLQLVVKLIWQLQPPWQQQELQQGAGSAPLPLPAAAPAQQQQHGGELAAAGSSRGPGDSSKGPSNTSSSSQILSPVSGECLDSLLEVLTAASKLPWEPHHDQDHSRGHPAAAAAAAEGAAMDDAASDASSAQSAGDVDAQLVAAAWQQECQPVAAAVEACLRTAGQVAAAADGALDWKPGGLLNFGSSSTAAAAAAVAAAAAGGVTGGSAGGAPAGAAVLTKVQRHPSAVALGSCLASLCAPFGRPGPLVAAAAAAQPGGPEQQQLFALLVSKLKVLLYNPASKKASLIAMHPIEQTPTFIIQQLCAHSSSTPLGQHGSQQPSTAAAPNSETHASPAALLPWLLLLSRLMVLRGKLLGHLLAHEPDESGKAGATSALHTAYWHVKMAQESASMLSSQLKGVLGSAVATEPLLALQQQQERGWVQSELQLQLLPALKQAVQVLRAAMKLSRHYHETGFASGFAAGFAAGYAAALAAASGVKACGPAAPGPVSFGSPWGVLQQSCIRVLPRQLEAVGAGLAWQLRHLGCSNPLCVNLSLGSELWLVSGSAQDAGSSGVGGQLDAAASDAVAGARVDRPGLTAQVGGEGHGSSAALCASCSKAAQGLL